MHYCQDGVHIIVVLKLIEILKESYLNRPNDKNITNAFNIHLIDKQMRHKKTLKTVATTKQ